MPELDGTSQQRLATLERRVEELMRTSSRQQAFNGRQHAAQQIRMAETAAVGGSYPTSGNTFGIIFQDISVSLPTSPGSQTVTRTDRTSTAADYATTVDGSYVSEGSYVAVTYKSGHWWILGHLASFSPGVLPTKTWGVAWSNGGVPYNSISYTADATESSSQGNLEVTFSNGMWHINETAHYLVVLSHTFNSTAFDLGVIGGEFPYADPDNFPDSYGACEGSMQLRRWPAISGEVDLDIDYQKWDNFWQNSHQLRFGLTCTAAQELYIGDRIRGITARKNSMVQNQSIFTEVWETETSWMAIVRLASETVAGAAPGPVDYNLLLETGDDLLLETGDLLLLEN